MPCALGPSPPPVTSCAEVLKSARRSGHQCPEVEIMRLAKLHPRLIGEAPYRSHQVTMSMPENDALVTSCKYAP